MLQMVSSSLCVYSEPLKPSKEQYKRTVSLKSAPIVLHASRIISCATLHNPNVLLTNTVLHIGAYH